MRGAFLRKSAFARLIFSSVFTLILLSSSLAWSYPLRPNPKWTPGSVCNKKNPDYTEDRYPEKIAYCIRNVSTELKKEIYELYNIPERCRHRYTIDHLIPLSIGGDNTPENLWPEHKLIKAERPDFELDIFGELKDGNISQEEAIETVLKEKNTFSRTADTTSCDR